MPLPHPRPHLCFSLALLLGLHQGLVQADGTTHKHALDAPMIQDQRQPARLQQEEVERQARAAALKARGEALIRQCWRLVEKQARHAGVASFQSAVIEEGKRLNIRGRVSLPDEKGQAATYDYLCRMNAGKRFFDRVTVTESKPDMPTP